MTLKHTFFLSSFALVTSLAFGSNTAKQPTLTIKDNNNELVLTRDQLLSQNNRKSQKLNMTNSRAYLGVNMRYQAVKICDLLKPFTIKQSDTIEFVSSDNFYALVPAHHVTNCDTDKSVAYIAIETSDRPWPKLTYNNPNRHQPDHGTAGPFAVVWTKPEVDYISNEYWAWKIIQINILHQGNISNVIPAPQHVKQAIRNGYHAYVSRCSGCHTINHIGKGKIGHDLNLPTNALTHFADTKTFKKFVRDPQSVRKKANDRMSGTSEQFLSNNDLDDLTAYLSYIGKHKA